MDKECQEFWKYWFMESLSSVKSTGMLAKKTAGVKEINEMQAHKVWDDCGTKLPKRQDFTSLHTPVSKF